jgi:hypothetical protein
MTEPSSREEFEHYHRDSLNEIELHVRREQPGDLPPAQQEIHNEQQDFYLNRVLKYFQTTGQTEPREVLRKGISALREVDQKRFLLQNMLEAVKQGKSLPHVIQGYHNMGLTNISITPTTNDLPDKKDGPFLLDKLRSNDQIALMVMKIAINALKAIPKLCSIKPTIGFVGPIPSISFTLEADSITISDLFDTLTQGLKLGPDQ